MKAKVYGIQKIEYTNKANRLIKGTSLHILRKDARVDGELAESIFVSDALDLPVLPNIKIGDMVNVQYNRYGSVDDVIIMK